MKYNTLNSDNSGGDFTPKSLPKDRPEEFEQTFLYHYMHSSIQLPAPIRKILEASEPRLYFLHFYFQLFQNTVVKERIMKFSDFRVLH